MVVEWTPVDDACETVFATVVGERAGISATAIGFGIAATFQRSAGTPPTMQGSVTYLWSHEISPASNDASFVISGNKVQVVCTGDAVNSYSWRVIACRTLGV